MPTSQQKEENQRRFLVAFEYALSISDACRAAEVSERVVQHWRHSDESFAEAFAATDIARGDFLEERMFAILDWGTQPENYKIMLQKPTLLIFALKATKSVKYGDKATGGNEELQQMLDVLMKVRDEPPAELSHVESGLTHELEELLGDLGIDQS